MTWQWPQQTLRRAEHVATTTVHAPIDLLVLSGGDLGQMNQLCGRLLGNRIETINLTAVASGLNPSPRR